MCNLCISADGGFSNWGVFTPCSATCGGGVQSRSRVCNNPLPQYNGKDCVGPVNETRACNTFYCPSKLKLHLYLSVQLVWIIKWRPVEMQEKAFPYFTSILFKVYCMPLAVSHIKTTLFKSSASSLNSVQCTWADLHVQCKPLYMYLIKAYIELAIN